MNIMRFNISIGKEFSLFSIFLDSANNFLDCQFGSKFYLNFGTYSF